MGHPKAGGRSKGTPNKKTQAVEQLLASINCNPIEGMAQIAMDETIDIGIRAQMFKELAQYIYPKRKAIEMSGSLDIKDVLAQRLAQARKRAND